MRHNPPGLSVGTTVTAMVTIVGMDGRATEPPSAAGSAKRLRFGPIRLQRIGCALGWPVLVGAPLLVASSRWSSHREVAVTVVVLFALLGVAVAARLYRMELVVEPDRLLIRRPFSTYRVRLGEVEWVGFSESTLDGLPCSLIVRITGGPQVKIGGVSQWRPFFERPGDGTSKAERRVEEFLRTAGGGLIMFRPHEPKPDRR